MIQPDVTSHIFDLTLASIIALHPQATKTPTVVWTKDPGQGVTRTEPRSHLKLNALEYCTIDTHS
jgi:hypothetical protein